MATDAHCVPEQGTLFAGRYRLLEPCPSSTSLDGQPLHWRGFDEVLNRPVLVTVMASDSAEGVDLLASAVANGRVAHPGIASVFDAANVDGCTYVVGEWVDGISLTEWLHEHGPMPTSRAAALVREAAETISVLHEQGLVHGNLDPGNVLLTSDGGVKLTSLRSNADCDSADDVRRLGALLYAALTERWPTDAVQAEVPGMLPAPYESGRLCEPRQVRAGVSGTLSMLTMRALDPVRSGTSASRLAGGLAGHVSEPALPIDDDLEPDSTRSWRRGAVLFGMLLVISLAGLVVGFSLGAIKTTVGDYPILGGGNKPAASPRAAAPRAPQRPADASILDPQGDGTELRNAQLTIDGDPDSVWSTDLYKRPKFGNLKRGMGVVLDLGSDRRVSKVTVTFSPGGTTAEIRTGPQGATSLDAFTRVASSAATATDGATVTYTLDQQTTARYWLVWLTELPPKDGGYQGGVAEVTFS
ncbi:MAG: protein kinase family protein [Actinomycetota bacterium]|nr:protein kinase family protein [Actinomycetota bacterium]